MCRPTPNGVDQKPQQPVAPKCWRSGQKMHEEDLSHSTAPFAIYCPQRRTLGPPCWPGADGPKLSPVRDDLGESGGLSNGPKSVHIQVILFTIGRRGGLSYRLSLSLYMYVCMYIYLNTS